MIGYVAHGLALSCEFELPGLRPMYGRGLRKLTLRRARQDDLRATWQSTCAQPLWRGAVADGVPLTLQRGPIGDSLFTYGERARFLLDPAEPALLCDFRATDVGARHALVSKVLAIVGVMLGYEALHASAVDSPQGVIAILAASGGGKTTLAVELMRRGWPLFSDDILTLARSAEGVHAHPATPHFSVASGHEASLEPLARPFARVGSEVWLTAKQMSAGPRPVRLLCLLDRARPGRIRAEQVAGTPLVLAPYMLGVDEDRDRQRQRFALYSDLVSATATVRLSAGPSREPAVLADTIERALQVAPREAAAVGGAA